MAGDNFGVFISCVGLSKWLGFLLCTRFGGGDNSFYRKVHCTDATQEVASCINLTKITILCIDTLECSLAISQGKRQFPKGTRVPPITDSLPLYCVSLGNVFVGFSVWQRCSSGTVRSLRLSYDTDIWSCSSNGSFISNNSLPE